MKKWICTNCNYRFETENPKDCPYCGMETLIKEKNASELLEEVGRLLEN